jgi:penicillin amidase
MKWLRAGLSLLVAALVFWGLNNPHGLVPPLGKLLDPFAGFWQNGTRLDELPRDLALPGLRDEVKVVWDSRYVPHIFARNDHDLYFAQGYVASSLRLWQMEFQVLYAAGRLSEIVGPKALELDRFHRRFGMVWGAERAVAAMMDDPASREAVQAYADGVNAYIEGLDRRDLPLEYKILDYAPEPWTPLKSALLIKYMSYTLAGASQDPAMTTMREALGEAVVDRLFPARAPLVEPVIPSGTELDFTPLPLPTRPEDGEEPSQADNPAATTSCLPSSSPSPLIASVGPGPDIGSNNWAVSGKLTASGFPILCNDMHLSLALPAIWHELQLAAPGVNVYGVSFPGAPTVVAGFNERIAWGFTNAGSDVLDWYAITFKDGGRSEYLYDGEWRKTSVREERIKVRGGKTVVDPVVYTHHGPVVRASGEPPFSMADVPPDAALRWLAHEPSTEFRTLHDLNRGRSYDDYLEALGHWTCPAQNIVYADADGSIAIWHNGLFPLRWKGQGRYLLDGSRPADEWRDWIPKEHNPHVVNPERGFVGSANQIYAAEEYPYYLGWDYASFERGARINEILSPATNVTPRDMIEMQADVVNLRARTVLPALLEHLRNTEMTAAESRSDEELRGWNFESRAASLGPTIFSRFWAELNALVWDDEKKGGMGRMARPASQVVIDLVLNAPDSEYFDDKTTPETESLADLVPKAFRAAVAKLVEACGPPGEAWAWGRIKNTAIAHLAKIPGFGRDRLFADGESVVINAIAANWGPSWRMVVALGPEVRAWGIYPGGQSGNPGSEHYDDFIDDWAAGKPYELLYMRSPEETHPGIVMRSVMGGVK